MCWPSHLLGRYHGTGPESVVPHRNDHEQQAIYVQVLALIRRQHEQKSPWRLRHEQDTDTENDRPDDADANNSSP